MNVQAEPGTFLTAVDDLGAALQSEDKLEALLSRVEAQARKLVPDLSTETSRGLVRSNAYEVAKSKTAMEKAALALTEDWRNRTKAVNGMRAVAVARLDALRDEVRAPLTKWEADEKARIERLEAAMADLHRRPTMIDDSAGIEAEIARISAIVVDQSWQEYEDGARRIQADAIHTLAEMLDRAHERETERAELEALRAEKAAREAEEKAAAEKAAAEARVAEMERKAREREAAEAKAREEAAARAAEVAREAAEREAQEKVAAAERAAREAEERAERAAIEAKAAALAEAREAEAAQARAVEAERARIAAEMAAQEAAERKRAEDAKVRARARKAIVTALCGIAMQEGPAGLVADALMDGRVPHMEFRP